MKEYCERWLRHYREELRKARELDTGTPLDKSRKARAVSEIAHFERLLRTYYPQSAEIERKDAA